MELYLLELAELHCFYIFGLYNIATLPVDAVAAEFSLNFFRYLLKESKVVQKRLILNNDGSAAANARKICAYRQCRDLEV